MHALLLALMLAQTGSCDSVVEAAARALGRFDWSAALERLAAAPAGCDEAAIAEAYLQGLASARDAYRFGGSPESLAPVRLALARLAAHAPSASAETARVVLLAASAGAQSEREEMALLLDHALALERQQRLAGERGAPIITAHEAAGGLWLQVHRFEAAALAYQRAALEIGPNPRLSVGLARTAAVLGDEATACREYQAVWTGWDGPSLLPPELVEARDFLEQASCAATSPRP